ncbi:MAG: UDP-N-acetylglucosamine 1-carboxyvinyltransferase [Clostridia bacterium]|nr:UDP-N-acetylglucosamine 1-carboxyvinyltransferase [Clostridia bacterium]
MEKIVVRGGKPLFGNVEISGMKNAALPIIYACVLIKSKCVIENVPAVRDVALSLSILREMGASVRMITKNTYEIDCTNIDINAVPYELFRQMRASYYLLGAELGRFGRASVGFPGGCDFGERPIDQHIKGFEALGGKVNIENGNISIESEDGQLKGTNIFFDLVSVGATINIMLAAVTAEGTTIIDNAAREPHIVDLANFLNTCGANIRGAGTDMIKIKGVKQLYGCNYAIIPDMIEAGTFMIAAAATKGCVRINNVIPKHLESVAAKLEEMGVSVEELDDAVVVKGTDTMTRTSVKTHPYPGYPTDMHPQMTVLLTQVPGVSYMTEGVYENRFRYVDELRRMGAQIKVDGRTAIIEGGTPLSAAPLKAVDLRAGVAMIIAGLIAEGESEITDIHLIERGYDDIVGKLRALGADIRRTVVPNDDAVKKAN